MADRNAIREHMEVKGSDGGHVGTVDHLDGERIKLTRTDVAADGEHRFIHLDSVDRVEAEAVVLNRTTSQAQDEWGVESVGAAPADDEEHGAGAGSPTAGP